MITTKQADRAIKSGKPLYVQEVNYRTAPFYLRVLRRDRWRVYGQYPGSEFHGCFDRSDLVIVEEKGNTP